MLTLILLLAAHLALTGFPGAAATLLVARKGVSQVPVLLASGLATSGAVAMLTFWLYFLEPTVGKVFSYLVLVASGLVCAWTIRGHRTSSDILRQLATPLVLWVLGSTFLVFLGFVHGGVDSPIITSTTRFSHPLPGDNVIPAFYAQWFYTHGHHGAPPIFPGEWLASDRPPLQIGYVLTQRAMGWDSHGLNYELLGVILQQLWIVGLWALLVASRVGRITRALTVVTVLTSDLALVNGFYVWPKLLPAAMLLAAAALVATPLWSELRRNLWAAALVATLLALALLGHGASWFGVAPLVVIAALRGRPTWRWLGVGVIAAIVLLLPWSMYQKYGDPPGNRLTKWMLAGATAVDNRSALPVVIDAYREAGVGQVLHNKAENFVAMVGGTQTVTTTRRAIDLATSGRLSPAVYWMRFMFFYYLLPSFGLLAFVPLLMVAARVRRRLRGPEWQFSLNCYAILVVGAVIWGLVLFGSPVSEAIIHQGSYLLPIVGFCAAVVGLRAAFPRLAIYYVGVSALLMLALYAPSLTPPAGTSYSVLAAVISAAALIGFGAVAFRAPGGVLEREQEFADGGPACLARCGVRSSA